MDVAQRISRALLGIAEASRGEVSLADFRVQCATLLGEVFEGPVLVGVLDGQCERILCSDSHGATSELPVNDNLPTGDVSELSPALLWSHAVADGPLLASAVLGSRVGAFFAAPRIADDPEFATLMLSTTHQLTIAMETILERAESFREIEALASEARSKTELLATVSHEARTPLSTIVSVPARLSETFASEDPVFHRALRLLSQSGQHLHTLLGDILDVSRLDAGSMSLVPGPVSIADCVASVADYCSGQAAEKGVEFLVERGETTQVIRGDSTRVTQILINLVTNGIKFTGAGGRVELRTRARDGGVEFVVRDTGIGIGEDQRAKIFEAFTQLDHHDHASYQGAGLGLSICHKLVDLHSGTIFVESTPGAGSTFAVWLPTDAEFSAAAILQNPACQSKKTILLVDDDATVLDTAQFLLEDLGHALVSTTDVDALADLVRQHHPALIMMDVTYHGRNRLDVLQQLRRSYNASELPVLVSSGLQLEVSTLEALGAGWLPKPWRRAELLHAIDQSIGAETSEART